MTTAKKYVPLGFVLAFALSAAHQQVLRADGEAKEFAFTTVDLPGTATALQGINDAGDVSGSYVDAAGIRHGFVLQRRERVATVVDFPGAAWTRLWGINPQGDVVGTYGHGPGTEIAIHGFLMSRDGEVTEIHYPGSSVRNPTTHHFHRPDPGLLPRHRLHGLDARVHPISRRCVHGVLASQFNAHGKHA